MRIPIMYSAPRASPLLDHFSIAHPRLFRPHNEPLSHSGHSKFSVLKQVIGAFNAINVTWVADDPGEVKFTIYTCFSYFVCFHLHFIAITYICHRISIATPLDPDLHFSEYLSLLVS